MEIMRRVLVVDDEANIRRLLVAGLRAFKFDVDVADSGAEALMRYAARRPDAIVLDVNMPGRDGFAVLDDLRRRTDVPIVMLTARDALDDKIDALALGADDYLSKPFEMAELAARLTAHLRRRPAAGDCLSFADVMLDVHARTACRGRHALLLSPKEFDLLELLLREQGRVFRKSQLLDRLWGTGSDIGIETVDRFVSLLRKKLEYDNATRLVQTVHGVGYVLRTEGGS